MFRSDKLRFAYVIEAQHGANPAVTVRADYNGGHPHCNRARAEA